MKQFICILMAAFLAVAAWGQKEQDFASRYMALYAKGSSLECTTVSPLMMDKLLKLPSVEEDSTTKKVLAQLKSIRMITNANPAETALLYDNALKLARQNPKRYQLQAEENEKKIYVRHRGNLIVEIVLLMKNETRLNLINLTGNMNKDFLQQLPGI